MHAPHPLADHISNNTFPCTLGMDEDIWTIPAGHLTVGTTAQARQVQQVTLKLKPAMALGAVLGACQTMPATCGSGCLQPRVGAVFRALGAGCRA